MVSSIYLFIWEGKDYSFDKNLHVAVRRHLPVPVMVILVAPDRLPWRGVMEVTLGEETAA